MFSQVLKSPVVLGVLYNVVPVTPAPCGDEVTALVPAKDRQRFNELKRKLDSLQKPVPQKSSLAYNQQAVLITTKPLY